jgi:hypothetical protein
MNRHDRIIEERAGLLVRNGDCAGAKITVSHAERNPA